MNSLTISELMWKKVEKLENRIFEIESDLNK